MNLKQFLKLKKISNADFAKNLNISTISLSRYIGGQRLPEKNILLKINDLTDGLVTPNDFYFFNEQELKLDSNKKKQIKNIAKNIKIAMPDAENLTTSGNHNPASNPTENVTFSVPTRYIIHEGRP